MCYLFFFSLAAFNICSLCLIFINLITMYLGCILGCFILGLSFLGFPGLGWLLPYPFGGVFNYYLKHFLMAFLSVFFFWDSYNSNVVAFNIVPEFSEVVLISFFFLLSSLFPVCIYNILSSTSLILSSDSIILLLVPSRVFWISFIALFIIYCLFYFF